MKFTVYRTSDYENSKIVEINTLDELLAFKEERRSPIILLADGFSETPFSLEIYDDYRE